MKMDKTKLEAGYFVLDWMKLLTGLFLVGYFTFVKKEPENVLSIIGGFIIALSNLKISFSKKKEIE